VLKDLSGECQLKLFTSGLWFEVEFYSFIPSKQPYYVNVPDNEPVKNGLKSKQSCVAQLCFEYARISQIHSVQQFPARWAIPLQMAWNFMWLERGDTPFIMPNFEALVSENTHQYACKTEITTELPKGSKGVQISGTKVNSGEISVWVDDDISPTTDFLKYKKCPLLVWDLKAVYRLIARNCVECLILKDKSVILANNGFFSHIGRNSSDIELSGLRKFTMTTVPIKLRSKITNWYFS